MPIRFIGEPIQVEFDHPPALEKKPDCPDRFIWRGEVFSVIEVLGEWQNFQRKGRMARNMRPTHAESAAKRGSLGVGEFYFRVRTQSDQIFDLYYDRSPKDVDHRKGEWFLFQELNLPSNPHS